MLPEVVFFCVHLARAVGNSLRPYGQDEGEGRVSFNCHETLCTKVLIINDPCLPPNSPLPPGSELAALCLHGHVPVPARLSRASCRCPHWGFLCSTVIPVTV